MDIDPLRNIWSVYGWELALLPEPAERRLAIHSCRRSFGEDLMWHLQALREGVPLALTATADVAGLLLGGDGVQVRLVPEGRDGLLLEAKGCDLGLSMPKHFGYGQRIGDRRALVLSSQAHNYTGVGVATGTLAVGGPEEALPYGHRRPRGSDLAVVAEGGRILLRLTVGAREPDPQQPLPALVDLATAAAVVQADWNAFRTNLPAVPAAHSDCAELAWWTLWSCFVRAEGHFAHDACLMSKCFMTNVWSWDHCFNAMALAGTRPRQALEQFLLPFHHQAASGALPDCFRADAEVIWAVSKPAIHGWAFARMQKLHPYTAEDLRCVYHHLERWTTYWLQFRDLDGNGLPEVPMGCDVQDNGASYLDSFFVTSPDAAAYLALQQRTLAQLARSLGHDQDAWRWEVMAKRLIDSMLRLLWDGAEFYSRDRHGNRTTERCASSLIMPLCLGAELPPDVFSITAKRLEHEFLGPFGVASQAFASPLYRDDEYWLGSVWPPLQLLLCDGLAAGGRDDLARRIAQGFLAACARAGGFHECFDARTGAGQRARSYSWTASTAIELMRRWG